MDWQALSAFAEVVAAIAVVVSLIYLAIQVKGNTQHLERTIQSVRTQTNQHLVENFNFYRQLLMDRNVAELYLKGLQDFESLEPGERVQFNMIASTYVWTAWSFYQINKNEELIENLNNRLYVDMFKHTGFREWFRDYQVTVEGDYGEFLSRVMEEVGDYDLRPGEISNLLQGRFD